MELGIFLNVVLCKVHMSNLKYFQTVSLTTLESDIIFFGSFLERKKEQIC